MILIAFELSLLIEWERPCVPRPFVSFSDFLSIEETVDRDRPLESLSKSLYAFLNSVRVHRLMDTVVQGETFLDIGELKADQNGGLE